MVLEHAQTVQLLQEVITPLDDNTNPAISHRFPFAWFTLMLYYPHMKLVLVSQKPT